MPITIQTVAGWLESLAPAYLQESYDNAGLITGSMQAPCTGVLCCLDATEAVVQEAINRNCNLIVAHHPILFKPLKKFSGGSYVERAIIAAIRNDIAIYAIHTNLDNILPGVNRSIADKLGLTTNSREILLPKTGGLAKLFTYVPRDHADAVREAIFAAGAGAIGNYKEVSFNINGQGTFRPMPGSNPFIGRENGERELVDEVKMEFILPVARQHSIIQSLLKAHPYEEVAYEVVALTNQDPYAGSGLIGELCEPMGELELLALLKEQFALTVVKHTPLLNRPIRRVAVCGGSGSFLIQAAIAKKADMYITADVKYHEFFDADGKLLLADIGHYESEQYTVDLLIHYLQDKIPTFAVLKTGINTNPVNYFV